MQVDFTAIEMEGILGMFVQLANDGYVISISRHKTQWKIRIQEPNGNVIAESYGFYLAHVLDDTWRKVSETVEESEVA